jgi:TrmH family RNA methyltransferase
MIKHLSSTQNQLIKEILSIKDKSSVRKEKKQFVVEGFREITMAITSSYELEILLFDASIIAEEKVIDHFKLPNHKLISVASPIYKKLAYRSSTEGVIAIVHSKNHGLKNLDLSMNPLILVMESIEKPGNIGAMLRTADAAGVDAVIMANPLTDIYNSNIIRASLGCLFSTQIAIGTTAEVISFLKKKKIGIYAASLKASQSYTSVNYKTPAALAVGAESTGLSQEFESQSTANIVIPMHGKIDSMNVSVSAAIILFEAVRVRSLNF